jgi:uracil-DNA glycosylase
LDGLFHLLESIRECNACSLMQDNRKLSIPYIPIHPKPDAKYMFIGRDPSPRTATVVGVREGKSVFINEVFNIADEAGIPEEYIYITDMCKCHWRTSRRTPWKGTKKRSASLPLEISEICFNTWLYKEIEIFKPKIIISFGDEVYQLLKDYIISPLPIPDKLSATKDKSIMDA